MINRNSVLEDIPDLVAGSHPEFGRKLSITEMAAFLAGEPHSPNSRRYSPSLALYAIILNDASAEFRALLKPLVPMMMHTKSHWLEARRKKHIIFGVAQRIVAPILHDRFGARCATPIMDATSYRSLRQAAEDAHAQAHADLEKSFQRAEWYKDCENYASASIACKAAKHLFKATMADCPIHSAASAAISAAKTTEQRQNAIDLLIEAIQLGHTPPKNTIRSQAVKHTNSTDALLTQTQFL